MNSKHDGPPFPPSGTSEWESEGGAAGPPDLPDDLPSGITANWVLEYRVGEYRYTSLADAKGEQQRRNRLTEKSGQP